MRVLRLLYVILKVIAVYQKQKCIKYCTGSAEIWFIFSIHMDTKVLKFGIPPDNPVSQIWILN
jgi:hypothetical protein